MLPVMTKKVLGKTRHFKYIAPTLMAGATAFGVSGAIAGFKAVVHDDTQHHTCHVTAWYKRRMDWSFSWILLMPTTAIPT